MNSITLNVKIKVPRLIVSMLAMFEPERVEKCCGNCYLRPECTAKKTMSCGFWISNIPDGSEKRG